MKKQFLNLGKVLNKAEQKQIFGGIGGICCEWSNGICIERVQDGHSCSITPLP